MTVAELRIVLEHLPDDLPVWVHGPGRCNEVRRRTNDPWVTPGVHLDATSREGLRLHGRFIDRRTLDVRLESLAEKAAS